MNTGWHPITPTTPRWRRLRRAIPAAILATLAALTVAFRADATQGTAQIGCTGPAELNLSHNAYGNPIDNPTVLILIGHTAATVDTPIGFLPFDPSDHAYTFQLPDDYQAGDIVWWAEQPTRSNPHSTVVLAAEEPCDTTTTNPLLITTTTNPLEQSTTTGATTTTKPHNPLETTTTAPVVHGSTTVPPPPGSTLPKTGGTVTEGTVATAAGLIFVGWLAIAGTRRRHRGS